jgi:outer membrane protein OmpA-like peptidoglycan-associated protein
MRVFTVLFFFVIFSITANSQSSYIKMIESGKYSKVEKKIEKELLKAPDDVELNFAKSVLLTNRYYKNYNTGQAYDYLLKSMRLLRSVNDEKELRKLDKDMINQVVLSHYLDTVCRYALSDAVVMNEVVAYQKFLDEYSEMPEAYRTTAIEKRNEAAFVIASSMASEESYQYFIDNYPDANQYPEAVRRRNTKAFEKAKLSDDIASYAAFLKKYPNAVEADDARTRIHEIAFEDAQKENTSDSYKQFIETYPKSRQYATAFRLFEERQYTENVIPGNMESYYRFVDLYASNSFKSVVQDSIFEFAIRTKDFKALQYCSDHLTDMKRNKALLMFHDIYTDDGEKETLDRFYMLYDDALFDEMKERDYQIAELGDLFELAKDYQSNDFKLYDSYIKLAAPREKAFVALQRMISADIATKNWNSAIQKLKSFEDYFKANDNKVKVLKAILESKKDNTIKVYSVGSAINTREGGEYVPVISADDKSLYFCGRGRKDNIGGEDIFVSQKKGNVFSKPVLINELSSPYLNDAPLSISTDGNTMLLFSAANLYYSEKTIIGWTESKPFPEQINTDKWEADAMLSSDGNALIFVSTREGGYNYSDIGDAYHGDYQYPADIYVSLLNENEEWDEPINVGPVINTIYCDRMPFLHPDMKTLYFSSDGHGGLGKLDVFKSTRLSDTCWNCWSEPVNMGKEINTEESDWGYKISTDGTKAYFSKKSGSEEFDDIYWLNLPNHLRPDLVATVSGKLLDSDSLPVSAEIRWEDLETGKSVGKSKSDPADGSFFIVLPLGKIYGYYVDGDTYFPISNNIDLRHADKPVEIEETIDMVSFKQMIEEGAAVPVNNLFFNFAQSALLPYSLPELRRVASIIKANSLKVEISGHTDNIGDEKENLLLSEHRAIAVKDFLIKEGCPEELLSTIGYGESKPVASNDSEKGRAKNRRVELRFIK